ncbi:MAG: TetR/AcrR family transcriptional regulator [Sneathiellales bacterium]|nr:TetR/AcrR family transcriptional regulator [Sneathiellales bacterium]
MSYSKSEKTQAKLLEATAFLLRTKGYNAMGLSDIIRESGIPKGSLYHHFPKGKDELSAAAISHSGKQMLVSLKQLIDKSGTLIEGLYAFFDYYINQLEDSGFAKGCPLATVSLETASGVPLVQHACKQAFDDIQDLLQQNLQKNGAGRKKAEQLATLAVASFEGSLLLSKARNETTPIRLMRDQLSEQLEPYSLKGLP